MNNNMNAINEVILNTRIILFERNDTMNEINCEIEKIKEVLRTKISFIENTIIINLRKGKSYDKISNDINIIVKDILLENNIIREIVNRIDNHILIPEIKNVNCNLNNFQILDRKTKIVKEIIRTYSNLVFRYISYPNDKGEVIKLQF